MLRLLARRALAQLPLLSAVVAMVTIGATLLGVCALMLTRSQEQALNQGLAQAPPDDVSVTAFVTDISGPVSGSVADTTRSVMTSALAPFPISSTELRASSVTRPLLDRGGETREVSYFSAMTGLDDKARLTTGRWPHAAGGKSGPFEAVVLQSTARRLDVTVGDRVRLDHENSSSDPGPALAVEIVGIAQPLPNSEWERDPLLGAGYDPAYTSAQYVSPSRTFGPFILDPADLWASRATMDRLQITAHPNLSNPTSSALNAAALSLGRVDLRLKTDLGDRIGNERVVSALPATLSQARFQQDVTRSTVLVVVLLGTTLTGAALGLAGRLMVSLRSSETALFSAMGAGPSQLATHAATEAFTLAAVSTVLAVPLSSLAFVVLTHLPRIADAGLAAPLGVTGTQVATVLVGALLLAAVLVVPALRPDPAQLGTGARGRLGILTRSGADLLLLVLAGAGWWQLHSQPPTATGTDTVRVVAPVLCLLAGAAVAPRVVAVPLRVGEWLARRSRGLVLPLALFEAARRPRAVAAGLLLALAAATGTFGLAFSSTWEQSQVDQAATKVGTDMTLAVAGPVVPGQAAAVAAATGGTVSPVADRNVILGRWVGDPGDIPRLLSIDSRVAGDVLQGRLPDGRTWADEGALLAPKQTVTGLPTATGSSSPMTLTATAPGSRDLQVVPRLVLQGKDGVRTPCDARAVPLDGRPHQLSLCGELPEGSTVIGLGLKVQYDPVIPENEIWSRLQTSAQSSKLTVKLSVPSPPGSTPAAAPRWWASPLGLSPVPITNATTTATTTASGTVLRTTADANLQRVYPEALQLVASSFAPPLRTPVLVSQRAAEKLQLSAGSDLSVAFGATPVSVVVAGIVPAIPAAPGGVALLVDTDLLSRALITTGELEPPIDAWWVGGPTRSDAAARATALNLGPVVTLDDVTRELSSGPLRVGLPAALVVLVPAVILLVLAGTIMHVTSDVDARSVEIARLRGLGLSRRDILGGLLAQHGGVLALLLGCGAIVGVTTSFVLAPLLVRSDFGAAPVPSPVASWPWSSETALLAVLLLGSMAAVTLVVSIQLRRADAAHLRVGA